MELVFLHALPFDGSMWAEQRNLLPSTHAPTLYGLGSTVSEWAAAVLKQVEGERLIVVGNSVGGSCALEMAALAPDRIAALVLIGTKAAHRVDRALRDHVISTLRGTGVDGAWDAFWAPMLSSRVLAGARHMATGLAAGDLERGVTAFHTRPSRDDLLGHIQCPVLWVTGEHDTLPGRVVTEGQAKLVQRGRFVVVPDSGHYVPLEQPDALNAMLRSLITELR